MKIAKKDGIDEGFDLNVGDIVFIKLEVIGPPSAYGDTKLRYLARNGKDEYAADSVNSVFIKRPGSRWTKKLLNLIAPYI